VNKRTINKTLLASILATTGLPSSASALQPLDDFVASARVHNPRNQEVRASRAAADAQAAEAFARALPGLTAAATYTRNQWDVSFSGLAVLPRNELDAAVTLSVPLVDLAKFARISAAHRSAEASYHQQDATARAVEAEVVQLYYQLAADLALVAVARKALEVTRMDLKLTEAAAGAGTAAALDVARARAEVEQRSQQVIGAELAVSLTAQALTSRTGIRPEVATPPELVDDLHAEPPLDQFLAGTSATPAVIAAAAGREAAQRNASAQRLALVPTLGAALVERYTNATGFLNGNHEAYAASLTLAWGLDFGTGPAIRARNAEVLAAKAREEEVRLTVGEAIEQAFRTIEADIARSRSARAQSIASARAADIARARYRSGETTQLDLLQADRDALAAEVARIQADGDLLNARRQLRLASGSGAP
jgi:outer membrane protein TolC